MIYDDLVIVQADIYEGSFIAAYNLKNGKLEWKATRADISSWGTPTIYRSENRDELVTNATTIRGYDPKTGERVYRQRVGAGTHTASPIAADGKLYFTTEEGSVVARAGAEYEELARNEMDEVCMSTPAISDGVLIVRTQKHVYGLGEKTAQAGGAPERRRDPSK